MLPRTSLSFLVLLPAVAVAACSLDWPVPDLSTGATVASTGQGGGGGLAQGGAGGQAAAGGAGGDGGMPVPVCTLCPQLDIAEAGGNVVAVAPGGDLQGAINAAQPGDVITLTAGEVYLGPIALPPNPGAPIRIQTANFEEHAPACQRLTLDNVDKLAVIVGTGGNAALVSQNGSNWQLAGVSFASESNQTTSLVVAIGSNDENDEQDLPQNILFDRVYVRGGMPHGSLRGIQIAGRNVTVQNSLVRDLWIPASPQTSHAIVINNTPGPVRLLNNELESSYEMVAISIDDPDVNDVIPNDILIQHNYMRRPTAWNTMATPPNHLRGFLLIHNATNVVVEGNRFDNAVWDSAIKLQPDHLGFDQFWARVQDIFVRNNTFVHVDGAGFTNGGIPVFNVQEGFNNNRPTRGIHFENNLIHSSNGQGILIGDNNDDRIVDVEISHNTWLQDGSFAHLSGGEYDVLTMVDNIIQFGEKGVYCDDAKVGSACLDDAIQIWLFDFNLTSPIPAGAYPDASNIFGADFGFVDAAGLDFHLAPGSPGVASASDGLDRGVDFGQFDPAQVCRSPE